MRCVDSFTAYSAQCVLCCISVVKAESKRRTRVQNNGPAEVYSTMAREDSVAGAWGAYSSETKPLTGTSIRPLEYGYIAF